MGQARSHRDLPPRLTGVFSVADAKDLDAINAGVDAVVQRAHEFARKSPEPDPATVRDSVFADPINPPEALTAAASAATRTTGWLEAVRDGIAEEMRRDPNIMYFGEGTGERGGTFAHTKGLWQEFGARHMVDTPSRSRLSPRCDRGLGTGARTIADLMFPVFLFEAAGQIMLQASKLRYMSNGQMNTPVVLRVGAGAFAARAPSQRHLPPGVGARPGSDRGNAVDPGRRQGPDEDGPARR